MMPDVINHPFGNSISDLVKLLIDYDKKGFEGTSFFKEVINAPQYFNAE